MPVCVRELCQVQCPDLVDFLMKGLHHVSTQIQCGRIGDMPGQTDEAVLMLSLCDRMQQGKQLALTLEASLPLLVLVSIFVLGGCRMFVVI